MRIYIRAELARNKTGAFVHRQVIFTILREQGQGFEVWHTFSREQIHQFYISRSDNRTAKLQIQDLKRNEYDDVKIVFQNVHKLF